MRIQDAQRAIAGFAKEIKFEALLLIKSTVAIFAGVMLIMVYAPLICCFLIISAIIVICKILIGSK